MAWCRFLDAVRQQAITWANVDSDIYHMASLGHFEFDRNQFDRNLPKSCLSIVSFLTDWGRVTHICLISLVRIVNCRLVGAKPLPEPILTYCQLDHWEQNSVNFESKYKTVFYMKMHLNLWKCLCLNLIPLRIYTCLPQLKSHTEVCPLAQVHPHTHNLALLRCRVTHVYGKLGSNWFR